MRWELRTRLFLRTTEFLWQEGHTAHATAAEAEAEALMILGVYRRFVEEWIAMPPLTGVKSDNEKFAGAVRSHSIEALMQDHQALQAGTSHFLGQNFAKQFDLKFQSEGGQEEYAWNTSWGVSTRLVGGMVMTHGDDAGLVVPPKIAPVQVVIVPILGGDDEAAVRAKCDEVATRLKAAGVRVKLDARDHITAGAKYYEWEPARLDAFQKELLEAARKRREASSVRGVTSIDELAKALDEGAGFVFTGWSGDPSVEAEVKERTKATLRAIVDEEFRSASAPARCLSGKGASIAEVAWARAY
jgi:prolyl-tRNA synthetase